MLDQWNFTTDVENSEKTLIICNHHRNNRCFANRIINIKTKAKLCGSFRTHVFRSNTCCEPLDKNKNKMNILINIVPSKSYP